ncbi:MAG: type VI secretion system contractile sheath large subunit, partial [Candidatus Eisenbacteria bacterium]
MPQQDLPLDLVVLADLGLPSGHSALGRVHRLEPDHFAAFMAEARPEVATGSGGAKLKLSFTDARGFRPESLATQIPDVLALMNLRQRVLQRGTQTRELDTLIAGLADGSPLKTALQSVVRGTGASSIAAPAASGASGSPASTASASTASPAPPPAPVSAPPSTAAGSDPLDTLFGMVDVGASAAPSPSGVQRPTTFAARTLDKLVGMLGAGRNGQAGSATQAVLAAVVDEAMSDSLRAVLADPAFQALEQAWSGLRFLLRRVDPRSGVRLFVLPTTRALLAAHARDALEPFAEEQRREPRVVVALADFDLVGDAEGLALAAALAAVAAENQSPMIAGADTALLGLESLAGI